MGAKIPVVRGREILAQSYVNNLFNRISNQNIASNKSSGNTSNNGGNSATSNNGRNSASSNNGEGSQNNISNKGNVVIEGVTIPLANEDSSVWEGNYGVETGPNNAMSISYIMELRGI